VNIEFSERASAPGSIREITLPPQLS
jgi:hypothetical protein